MYSEFSRLLHSCLLFDLLALLHAKYSCSFCRKSRFCLLNSTSTRVSVGEAFIHLSTERVHTFLDSEKKKHKDTMAKTNEEIDKLNKDMSLLKEQLYAKFKDNINLEENEEKD